MADTIRLVEYFYVMAPQKPGVGAALARRAAAERRQSAGLLRLPERSRRPGGLRAGRRRVVPGGGQEGQVEDQRSQARAHGRWVMTAPARWPTSCGVWPRRRSTSRPSTPCARAPAGTASFCGRARPRLRARPVCWEPRDEPAPGAAHLDARRLAAGRRPSHRQAPPGGTAWSCGGSTSSGPRNAGRPADSVLDQVPRQRAAGGVRRRGVRLDVVGGRREDAPADRVRGAGPPRGRAGLRHDDRARSTRAAVTWRARPPACARSATSPSVTECGWRWSSTRSATRSTRSSGCARSWRGPAIPPAGCCSTRTTSAAAGPR